MTREEAIYTLRGLFIPCASDGNKWGCDRNEALDMAIEALSEPKTIIGIDIPYGSDKGLATVFKGNEKMVLEEVKEIMSVVRCKDCRWWNSETNGCNRNPSVEAWHETDFCKYGERADKCE